MTLILQATDIKKCVQLNEDLIPIIEDAFKNLALGKTTMPPILRLDVEKYHGETDVKAAYIEGLDSYAVKVASAFFDNPKIDLPSSTERDELWSQLMKNDLLILVSGDKSIRFRPHLNVKSEDIDKSIEIISKSIKEILR